MSYQCLRHARIDAIHGHVVSVIGSPAKCELRHVSRTDDQGILLVRNIHKHLCAFSRLPVLIGNIMTFHVLSDVREMSGHCLTDIHFPKCRTQSLR